MILRETAKNIIWISHVWLKYTGNLTLFIRSMTIHFAVDTNRVIMLIGWPFPGCRFAFEWFCSDFVREFFFLGANFADFMMKRIFFKRNLLGDLQVNKTVWEIFVKNLFKLQKKIFIFSKKKFSSPYSKWSNSQTFCFFQWVPIWSIWFD